MRWTADAREILDRRLEEIRRGGGPDIESQVSSLERFVREELERRGVDQVTGAVLLNILGRYRAPDAPREFSGGPPPSGSAGSPMPPPLPPKGRPASSGPALAGHVPRPPAHVHTSSGSQRGCLFAAIITLGSAVAFTAAFGGFVYYSVFQVWEQERSACVENLVAIGEVLAQNADPDTGYYPPLSSEHDPYLPGSETLEALETSKWQCPAAWYDEETDEEILSNPAYVYLGYAIRNVEELEAYVEAYIAADGDAERLMESELEGPDGPISRLHKDLAAPETIPVLIEWDDYYHLPSGAHVLYLDGHVEFLEMDEKFPVERAVYGELLRVRNVESLSGCRNNLEALGKALSAQAQRDGGLFPPLLEGADLFLFGGPILESLDPTLVNCPAYAYFEDGEDASFDQSDYVYLGFSARDGGEAKACVEAMLSVEGDAAALSTRTDISGPKGAIPRLSLDLPNAGEIPLLVERSGNHNDGGGHVLYLDGHIEYLAYGDAYPMSEEFWSAIDRATEHRHLARCKENVIELEKVLNSYAQANNGEYPTITTEYDSFLFGDQALGDVDTQWLRCPSAGYYGETEEEILEDADYIYLGLAVHDQEEMDALQSYLEANDWDWDTLKGAVSIPGPNGDISRLKKDLPSPESIPVLVEWWGYHGDSGGHVLYLDGHIEFVPMESKFPMTSEFFDSLYGEYEEPSVWSVFWEALKSEL